MNLCSTEGLLGGAEALCFGATKTDNRELIDQKDDKNAFSSFSVDQIEGSMPGKGRFVGTGEQFVAKNATYLLTCAHNVVGIS